MPIVRTDAALAAILREAKVIAVVGLSANPARPSHEVARYLQSHGYRIVPVNPRYAGQRVLKEPCYADLAEAAAQCGSTIDIVDCFRQASEILPLAEQAILVQAQCLWMQAGICNDAAAALAAAAGLKVVMDQCTKQVHRRLLAA